MKKRMSLTEFESESILSEMEKLSVYGGLSGCNEATEYSPGNGNCNCKCTIYSESTCGL